MPTWTVDTVTALAPDSASASAGQALASLSKWSSIGASEIAIWGLCQGSGKQPYQTRIDLSEPAFKCSCPSRKFPCKHAIALLLLYAKDAATFKLQPEPPGWVAEWLDSRASRAEKRAERSAAAAADKPVDLEAQAKRAASREARVRDGIAGCQVWLEDLLRRGLAAAQTESTAVWQQTAARMTDAQAPGLAAFIQKFPKSIASGLGWETRTLELAGQLHLLLTAGDQVASLPPEVAFDVRTTLGWNQPKDDVLATPAVADRWLSVGQVVEEEDRLRVRRTWLIGRQTARRALILDFAVGAQPLEISIAPSVELDAELVFYPGKAPLRALVKTRSPALSLDPNFASAADTTIETALRRYAEALAGNPWLPRWPFLLSGTRVVQDQAIWSLADTANDAIPLHPAFVNTMHLWRLLSISGGEPLSVLAEWDGHFARPLSAINEAGYHDLAPRWAA